MFNLNTLDTAIAVVIVLLILSLVVQSVQQSLKKLLKIKSRQIEDSLVDLFEHILDQKPEGEQKLGLLRRIHNSSPLLRMITGEHPADGKGDVTALFKDVKKKFEQAGRVSQRGKLMLDSIAKSDLMKVLGSVAPDILTPNIRAKLTEAKAKFDALVAAVENFRPSEFAQHMSADSKEKLAKMQGALRPLIQDVRAILEGGTLPQLGGDEEEEDAEAGAGGGQAGAGGGQAAAGEGGAAAGAGNTPPTETQPVTSARVFRDLKKLNEVRLEEVSSLIKEAQSSVEEQLARAEQDPNGQVAADALRAGAEALRGLAQGVAFFDRTVEQILVSLTRAERWFDTVMQSFEERYTRSMKTWGVAISLVVVILLNANFFEVYKNISTNDTTRANLLQMSDAVTKQVQAAAAANDPNAVQAAAQNLGDLAKQTKENISQTAGLYTGLGFSPIWVSGHTVREHPWNSLLGWLVMAMLLSVGAPFWEDVLESLFGLKNILRKKSDTKNVEDKGGQPRP